MGCLPPEKRAEWDALVAAEGARLGLTDCRVFLEGKLVNDIFYAGSFKGAPCVVKCSSRAPESIANEYGMSRRLFAAEPLACAEPLALWRAADGSRAFVVTRKLPGPSLTDMFVRGVDEDEAIDAMEDLLRIAAALLRTGIVWRDIIPDNFLRDADGHLKLIDAQFAVDRNGFREDPYLLAHRKYRLLLFAHHPMMYGRGWNDVAMMRRYARYLPPNEAVKAGLARLEELSAAAAFPVAPTPGDVWRTTLWLAGLSLMWCITPGARHRRALRERIGRAWRFLKGGR